MLIFSLGFTARLLSWQDTRLEVGKVQTAVTEDYKRLGRLLSEHGVASFLDPTSPSSDPSLLGHPPGYSFLWALVFTLCGDSDVAVQSFQVVSDAVAAVVLFLIVLELLPLGAAIAAGVLVALAPQFTWNSVLLLPDTLAILPVLLAVYSLVRAYKRPRLVALAATGALVGLSCWLRANALLLAPFLCLLIPILFNRGQRIRYAAALLCGAVLVIAPLTIRNAMVFGHFIPLSIGAGQAMLEGIADYDREGRFGIPATDLGIMRQEAERFGRPDYAETLFGPDGVKRERVRLARAFGVIRSHPLWFAGVTARRAASMLRLERVRRIAAHPPVTRPLAAWHDAGPMWAHSPAELIAKSAFVAPQAETSLTPDASLLYLTGDSSEGGDQIVSAPIPVHQNHDYVLTITARPERGRMAVKVVDADQKSLYVSTIIEAPEGSLPGGPPGGSIQLPFVSVGAGPIRVVLSNEDSARPELQLGTLKLFALGPASHVWTRFPRAAIRGAQSLFITAVMLPLVVTGILLLAVGRQGRTLAILLVVPAYYLCVQSALHTEYRYVLAVQYFLFIPAAVALYRLGTAPRRLSGRRDIEASEALRHPPDHQAL